jgi:hypothetical protein
MIEFQAWCETCKRASGFELVDGKLRCESCKSPHAGASSPPDTTPLGCLAKFILLLLVIGLVFLAFVYATRSSMRL